MFKSHSLFLIVVVDKRVVVEAVVVVTFGVVTVGVVAFGVVTVGVVAFGLVTFGVVVVDERVVVKADVVDAVVGTSTVAAVEKNNFLDERVEENVLKFKKYEF